MTILTDEKIKALAHRRAWRYKKSSDPHHSDTYTFNNMTLIDFVRHDIEAAVLEAQKVTSVPVGTIGAIMPCGTMVTNVKEAYEAGQKAAPVVQPDIAAKYNELLMCVGNKYHGESRHETALRYLRERETQPLIAAAEGKEQS